MNYKLKNSLLTILISLLICSSCTQDKGPIEPIITIATVSFENDIQPIFDANCTVCHSTALSQYNGYLDLSENNSYTDLVGVISNGYDPVIRVVSGDYENSVLWGKINESDDFGATMPLGGVLSATEIEIIKVWIVEGALEN